MVLATILSNKIFQISTAAVGGGIVGYVIGTKTGKKKAAKKTEPIIVDEDGNAKTHKKDPTYASESGDAKTQD